MMGEYNRGIYLFEGDTIGIVVVRVSVRGAATADVKCRIWSRGSTVFVL